MLITTRITLNDYDLEEKKIRKKTLQFCWITQSIKKTLGTCLKIMFFIFLNCSGSTPVFLYTETVIFFLIIVLFLYTNPA